MPACAGAHEASGSPGIHGGAHRGRRTEHEREAGGEHPETRRHAAEEKPVDRTTQTIHYPPRVYKSLTPSGRTHGAGRMRASSTSRREGSTSASRANGNAHGR